jgi:uncharacterized protein (TIGR02270 family)
MPELDYPPVLHDVLEEHFEELDFLWELREGVLFAPDWTLEDLAEIEERAETHLDALRLAGGHAVDLTRPALAGEEVFAATAATLVFMETGRSDLTREVLEAFRKPAAPEPRDGIRIGLRHSTIDAIRKELLKLAADRDAALAAAAADVLAFHRVPVPDVDRLRTAEDPTVRVLAYGAAGKLRGMKAPDDLRPALGDQDSEVRWAALRAAALSGMPGLEDLCRRAAMDRSAPNPEALGFLGVLGNPVDLPLLRDAVRRPETTAVALAALGALGKIEAVELLLDTMADKEHGPEAAAAFRRITGAEDIDAERPPPSLVGGPDPDSGVDEEFEDDAPPPDPQRAREWWEATRGQFSEDGRWQAGIEWTGAVAMLDRLPLQARRDVYLAACSRGGFEQTDLELEGKAWSSGSR